MDKVTADRAYSSKDNMQVIEDAGAAAYIPFKGGWPTLQLEMMSELHPETSVFYRMKHMFIHQRMFLQHTMPQQRGNHVQHDQAEVW